MRFRWRFLTADGYAGPGLHRGLGKGGAGGGKLEGMASGTTISALKKSFVDYVHTGFLRVRSSFFQSLQIVVSGIGAYVFAERVVGHTEPIFAATAAIVSLGYISGATHARRILEVSLGVTLGVLTGDLLMLLLGRGIWQAALVLFISILIARFLDNGIIFTIQMGLQSCLVVLMPAHVDGPFARSIDAIVGGVFAFLLMFLFPKDPRRSPRENARKLMTSFSRVFSDAAAATSHYDGKEAWQALAGARRLQPLYDACEKDIITSKGMARLAWSGRAHMKELERHSAILHKIDYAIRNTRVLNRRLASTINNVQISAEATASIAGVLKGLSEAVLKLGAGLSAATPQERREAMVLARRQLTALAGTLEPHMMGVRTLEAEALVLMLRPLVVDLLEASGLTHDEATAMLVPLGDYSPTEHAPSTTAVPVQQDPGEKHREDTRQLTTVLRYREQASGAAKDASLRDPRSMPALSPQSVQDAAQRESAERVEKQQQLNTQQLTIIEQKLSRDS